MLSAFSNFSGLGAVSRRTLPQRIRSLFTAGEQGVWYDPSDFSTMFQDSAGTTPVTAVEQPVGKILDKSGRGNHATQATSSKRPTLKQDGNGKYYLKFDGVDDALVTGSIDFTAGDKMTVFAGVRKLSDASEGELLSLSVDPPTSIGVFSLASPGGSGTEAFSFRSRGTSSAFATIPVATFPAPTTKVIAAIGNISGDISTLRVNSAQVATSSTNQGTGNYGNYPLYIGARAGTLLPFNGHLYGLIVRGAQSTDAQIVSAETYVNSKTGAY